MYHKTTKCVCGGYVGDVFTGEAKYVVGHANNFIFSLNKDRPIKLMHNVSDPAGYGVYLNSATYGLLIGNDFSVFYDTDGYGWCRP